MLHSKTVVWAGVAQADPFQERMDAGESIRIGFAHEIPHSDRDCFFRGGKIEEQDTPAGLVGDPQRERT